MTIKQPEVQSKKYHALMSDIESGRLKIPKFQRTFVWTKEQAAALIDSVLKGYPIGTFILWRTREELRHYKEVGDAKLPEVPKGDFVSYVLDGQQRITALFATRQGLSVIVDRKKVDFSSIYVDLTLDSDTSLPLVCVEKQEGHRYVSVSALLTENVSFFAREFGDVLDKIDTYRSRLMGYDFSTVAISDYPIDVACDIFTRINTGGTVLTLFEIMAAKTYDEERGFDLALKYDQLVNGDDGGVKCLDAAGYETIPDTTVLQCVSAALTGEARRETILKLDKSRFVDAWDDVVGGLFSAVDYLSTQLRIPVSGLLPYNSLLVPFTYFFVKTDGHPPTPNQNSWLIEYFWRASLSARFSSAAESKIGSDVKKMDKVLGGEAPTYDDFDDLNLTPESIEEAEFSAGDSFSKSILCLYAFFEPKSFKTNALVKLDNSWLKIATSKNYHHFFPKAYLRDKDWEAWYANVVANLTIVDDYLNKREIGKKPPSEYLRAFERSNHRLEETMKSHLIDDLNEFGVWDDDYEKFIKKRTEKILKELNSRINPGV